MSFINNPNLELSDFSVSDFSDDSMVITIPTPMTDAVALRKRKRTGRKMQRQQRIASAANPDPVIELLSSDDNEEEHRKPLAASKRRSRRDPWPMQDGEVVVLDGPLVSDQRKPPPAAAAAAAAAAPPHPPSPLLRVLEIFPDADVGFVQKKLLEQDNNFEIVVAVLSENDDYPKQQRKSDAPLAGRSDHAVVKTAKSSEPLHNYSSPTAVFEISRSYQVEVFELLLYDFSFLKHKAVRTFLLNHQGRYTLTRNHIHDLIVGKGQNPPVAARAGSAAADEEETEHYQLLKTSLLRGKIPYSVSYRLGTSICLAYPRKKIGVSLPKLTDPTLIDEHFFYKKNFSEWLDKVRDKIRGQAANKQALEDGSAVPCGCCFSDVAVSECIPCSEDGHLFCKECMVQYVESQVFGSGNLGIDKVTKKPALEIKCCDASGCNSGFRDELLQRILPPKTWEKYSEMQAKAQIELAGLGDCLAMCPKCGYQAEVPETQNNFECPVEGCHFVSCRKCGKASHIPFRCDEVVINRQDEGRLKIEEALSEAKMRTCPRCKKKFIKTDGCNKMTCPCGMKMCYVCRMPLDEIKGSVYQHFCQVPHCKHKSCGRCQLYTNDEDDDAQAMREAGIAAKAEYEAKLHKEGATESLDLDVDEMMQKPSGSNRKTKQREERLARARIDPIFLLPNPIAARNNPYHANPFFRR